MPGRRAESASQAGPGGWEYLVGGELGESPVVGLVYKRGNQAAAVGQIGVVWKVRGCL